MELTSYEKRIKTSWKVLESCSFPRLKGWVSAYGIWPTDSTARLCCSTYLMFVLMRLQSVLCSVTVNCFRPGTWNLTLRLSSQAMFTHICSRINLSLVPAEVRAVFLHQHYVLWWPWLKVISRKRVYFGLQLRRVSSQWRGRHGNRRPEKAAERAYLQPQAEAERKNWKWGEAVNPQSPPAVRQGRLPSMTFADSADSSGSVLEYVSLWGTLLIQTTTLCKFEAHQYQIHNMG